MHFAVPPMLRTQLTQQNCLDATRNLRSCGRSCCELSSPLAADNGANRHRVQWAVQLANFTNCSVRTFPRYLRSPRSSVYAPDSHQHRFSVPQILERSLLHRPFSDVVDVIVAQEKAIVNRRIHRAWKEIPGTWYLDEISRGISCGFQFV